MATTNINAYQDTYISITNPNSNYYLESDFNVNTRITGNQSQDVESIALFKYNIATINQTGTISSAILHIYGGGSAIQAPSIKIFSVPDTWAESTVTWNTAPVYGSQIGSLNTFRKSIGTLATNLSDNGNKWQTADLTTYVNTQFKGSNKVEIALKPHTGYNVNTQFKAILSGALQSYLTIISTL